MRRRFSLLALAAVLLAASPAYAEPGSWADAPEKLPRAARGDRTKNLDFLFEALKAAPDADSAKLVESRIWALWLASGSDTTDPADDPGEDRDRRQRHQPRGRIARRGGRAPPRLCGSLEPARHAALRQQGLWQVARRHP
jgi:hypothetical protein